MAGHSHWAGIKHKKNRVDNQRSKIFSKLSREITVAAKCGLKDAAINARLRSAIQAARIANMPKHNIERAIKKSEINPNINYERLRYEGFGPEKIAVIVEALTDNKNRTASNVRRIFQKFGGNLGETGVASHYFKQAGMIKVDKNKISEETILELATNLGAYDCISDDLHHIIITEKESFYEVKIALEKQRLDPTYSGIIWQPINKVFLDKKKFENIESFLDTLENDDDVQKIYTNFEIKKSKMKII